MKKIMLAIVIFCLFVPCVCFSEMCLLEVRNLSGSPFMYRDFDMLVQVMCINGKTAYFVGSGSGNWRPMENGLGGEDCMCRRVRGKNERTNQYNRRMGDQK